MTMEDISSIDVMESETDDLIKTYKRIHDELHFRIETPTECEVRVESEEKSEFIRQLLDNVV